VSQWIFEKISGSYPLGRDFWLIKKSTRVTVIDDLGE
jgi:hypothetical protein